MAVFEQDWCAAVPAAAYPFSYNFRFSLLLSTV
jgi:hypothetical protein